MGRQTCDTSVTSFYILLQFPQLGKESKSGIRDPSTSERNSDLGGYITYNPSVRLSGRPRYTSRLWRSASFACPLPYAPTRCNQRPSSAPSLASSRSTTRVTTFLHWQMPESGDRRLFWLLQPNRTSTYASLQAMPYPSRLSSDSSIGPG